MKFYLKLRDLVQIELIQFKEKETIILLLAQLIFWDQKLMEQQMEKMMVKNIVPYQEVEDMPNIQLFIKTIQCLSPQMSMLNMDLGLLKFGQQLINQQNILVNLKIIKVFQYMLVLQVLVQVLYSQQNILLKILKFSTPFLQKKKWIFVKVLELLKDLIIKNKKQMKQQKKLKNKQMEKELIQCWIVLVPQIMIYLQNHWHQMPLGYNTVQWVGLSLINLVQAQYQEKDQNFKVLHQDLEMTNTRLNQFNLLSRTLFQELNHKNQNFLLKKFMTWTGIKMTSLLYKKHTNTWNQISQQEKLLLILKIEHINKNIYLYNIINQFQYKFNTILFINIQYLFLIQSQFNSFSNLRCIFYILLQIMFNGFRISHNINGIFQSQMIQKK